MENNIFRGAPETVSPGLEKSKDHLGDYEHWSTGTQAAHASFNGIWGRAFSQPIGLLSNFVAALIAFAQRQAAPSEPTPVFSSPLRREDADVLLDALLDKVYRRVPLKAPPGGKGEQCPFSGLNRNQFYELFLLEEDGKPVIKNFTLAEPDEKTGARFYCVGSVLKHLKSRPARTRKP